MARAKKKHEVQQKFFDIYEDDVFIMRIPVDKKVHVELSGDREKFYHFDKMKDGKWRFVYTENIQDKTIPS